MTTTDKTDALATLERRITEYTALDDDLRAGFMALLEVAKAARNAEAQLYNALVLHDLPDANKFDRSQTELAAALRALDKVSL